MKFIIIVAALLLLHVAITQDSYKVLNNYLSLAVTNAINDGTLQLTYNASTLDRLPPPCSRNFNTSVLAVGVVADIITNGTLKIGVSTLSVNTSSFNEDANGNLSGSLYEQGNLIANQLGFVLNEDVVAQYVIVPAGNDFFESVTTALSQGTVHTFLDITYLSSRAREVDFTCWYIGPNRFAIYYDTLPSIFNATAPSSISGWNNPELRFGIINGTDYHELTGAYLPSVILVPFSNTTEMLNAVGSTVDTAFVTTDDYNSFVQATNKTLTKAEGTETSYGGGIGLVTFRNVTTTSAPSTTTAPTSTTTAGPTTSAPITTAGPTTTTAAPTTTAGPTTTAAPTATIPASRSLRSKKSAFRL